AILHRLPEGPIAVIEEDAHTVIDKVSDHEVVEARAGEVGGSHGVSRRAGVMILGLLEGAVAVAQQHADAVGDLIHPGDAYIAVGAKVTHGHCAGAPADRVLTPIRKAQECSFLQGLCLQPNPATPHGLHRTPANPVFPLLTCQSVPEGTKHALTPS